MSTKSLQGCRILYVEDEPLIAMDAEAMLHELGCEEIVIAMTFEDARAAIQDNQFDLAIMDINLGGGKTSLPLVAPLRRAGTGVVLASGYNSGRPEDDTIRLEKPFDEEALLRALRSALSE
ncbi:MAG: response regulator [Hyphomicrobiaceae bacterium]